MIAEAKVPVHFGQRLQRPSGVERDGAKIVCDQDGDRPGLCRQDVHRCQLRGRPDGRQPASPITSAAKTTRSTAKRSTACNSARRHISSKCPSIPTAFPAIPTSGLLPGVHAGSPGEQGQGDQRVQAYNFRMCLTNVPENRVPFPKPAGYDPQRYELGTAHDPGRPMGWTRPRVADAQSQDRHQQPGRLFDRQHRHELRLSRRRLCDPRKNLAGSRYLPAWLDVVSGQRSARARAAAQNRQPSGGWRKTNFRTPTTGRTSCTCAKPGG